MLNIKVETVGRGTKANVLASCQISLSTEDGEVITIFDARVLRNRSGGLWVGFPTENTKDFEGTMKFLPIISFSRELKHRITVAVLAEFEREDAEADVRSEHLQVAAVRPAVKPVRQAIIGSSYGREWNNGR
jgi:DNA-binding cell septation regulator SpoVG